MTTMMICSTPVFTTYNGAPCRVWIGKTQGGVGAALLICSVVIDSRISEALSDAELADLERTGEPTELRAALKQTLGI